MKKSIKTGNEPKLTRRPYWLFNQEIMPWVIDYFWKKNRSIRKSLLVSDSCHFILVKGVLIRASDTGNGQRTMPREPVVRSRELVSGFVKRRWKQKDHTWKDDGGSQLLREFTGHFNAKNTEFITILYTTTTTNIPLLHHNHLVGFYSRKWAFRDGQSESLSKQHPSYSTSVFKTFGSCLEN